MYFGMKNYLKSTHNHTVNQAFSRQKYLSLYKRIIITFFELYYSKKLFEKYPSIKLLIGKSICHFRKE